MSHLPAAAGGEIDAATKSAGPAGDKKKTQPPARPRWSRMQSTTRSRGRCGGGGSGTTDNILFSQGDWQVPLDFDYRRSTNENYRCKDAGGAAAAAGGAGACNDVSLYQDVRATRDHKYHGTYTRERQLFQGKYRRVYSVHRRDGYWVDWIRSIYSSTTWLNRRITPISIPREVQAFHRCHAMYCLYIYTSRARYYSRYGCLLTAVVAVSEKDHTLLYTTRYALPGIHDGIFRNPLCFHSDCCVSSEHSVYCCMITIRPIRPESSRKRFGNKQTNYNYPITYSSTRYSSTAEYPAVAAALR